MAVLQAVPRHRFVPPQYRHRAYEDRPLPIGYGQTISQPYIVDLMTKLLAVQTGERVLEVGTGSGYQAAVLAKLTDAVYSVEVLEPLLEQARRLFEELGYDNIRTKQGNGYHGWVEEAPFDAIIVTAAPDHLPKPLLAQLVDGGRMVIPVGPQGAIQTLWRVTKEGDSVQMEEHGKVRFVPLVAG